MKPNTLKFKRLAPEAQAPKYATDGAACFDLHAIQAGDLRPCDSQTWRTGLSFEVPDGYAMLVFSRSGHGFKHGVRLVNSVGVIDSDYRGEVMVKLRNDGHVPVVFEPGDRIAQAMVIPVEKWEMLEAEELSSTDRGTGGFGSTGA